jgi:hypothetical protein
VHKQADSEARRTLPLPLRQSFQWCRGHREGCDGCESKDSAHPVWVIDNKGETESVWGNATKAFVSSGMFAGLWLKL